MQGGWAISALYRSADEVYGLPLARLLELYRDCDALLNICGATVLNDDHLAARRRVYVETDPVTNQLELLLGRDLQFIRINGTLVGGLIGLLLHTFSQQIG